MKSYLHAHENKVHGSNGAATLREWSYIVPLCGPVMMNWCKAGPIAGRAEPLRLRNPSAVYNVGAPSRLQYETAGPGREFGPSSHLRNGIA